MAGATLNVHPVSNAKWLPLEQAIGQHLAGELMAMVAAGENGSKPKLHALLMTDPDGEAHAYVFDDNGRQVLVRNLTGGLVVPSQ